MDEFTPQSSRFANSIVPRSSTTDWKQKWLNNQYVDEEKFYAASPNVIIEKNYGIKKQRRDQYKLATGYGFAAMSTKLLFTYLGGLIQARKQFIPGVFYFRNHYYNWVKGMKYIIPGFIIGTLVSTFTFGHPFLLEDIIRNKLRHLTKAETLDGGTNRYMENRRRARDLFVSYEEDYRN